MGLDIFKNISTVDDARNRLHSIIESLKASCLLLECKTCRRIHMHDLVRDVAITIARRDKHVYKLKTKDELKKFLTKDCQEKLSNLSEIEVCQCNSMENIVLGDVPDEKVEFRSLRSLTFQHLDKLDNFFCSELMTSSITSTRPFFCAQVAFPNLETLKLSSLNLNKFWDENQHSMYNLSVLIVENCGELKYLFSSTMVQSFVNLKRLEISNCNLMNEIIATERRNDVSIALKEVPFPKLETIVLKDMENLKTVWHYQFDTVKTLEVQNSTGCSHLEELHIKDCGKMKEIVLEKTESTCASPTFEFNQLHTILLWNLHSLKGFYAGNHILTCPSLRKLDVYGCAKFNLYKTVAPSASSLHRCQDENLSDLFQPLFIVEEVIPNLEWMRINDRDAMMIMQAQNLDSLFNKLTFLGLADYNNNEATFPYWFLQNAPSLERLVVSWSSFKKIFEDETLVSMKIHTRLKKLTLYQLPKLQHICEEGSQIHPVLEVLEHLTIQYCPSLTNLLPSSVAFSHLTYLRITNCNKLVNLISSSTAQSLVKLTTLKVEDCDSLQEIIMGKDDVDIAFVSLKKLILKGLPSLNNFCSSKRCLKFPLLELVVVSNCPLMDIFSEGNTGTPSLRKVRIEENSEEWTWNGNLNDTIKKMFEDKVAFRGLKTLKLSPLNLHKIWNDSQHSMYNMTVLIVENCGELKYLFSSTMVQSFVNLKRLEISNCNLMNEIIATERRNDVSIALKEVPFPKLETIVLKDMENLKTGFYAGNHILACPSLRKLDVANCAKLNLYKTVAPSASRLQRCEDENLSDLFQPLFIVEEVIPHLEWMRINDRNAMMILQSQNLDSLFNKLTFLGLADYNKEEATFPYWFLQNARSLEELVVSWSSFKKIFDDERLVSMKIHTRLKKLTLYQLPKLRHICEEGSQIHPVLEHLTIQYCPSLTNLLPSSVAFSHLTYLRITNCNKLVNLISSSTVQSLVKLTTLKVEDCDSLQEIIMGKDDVDIAFVSLKKLILKGLPSLNNFCSSKRCLKFPLLELVVVSNCPLMDIFSEGNTGTPSLRKVRIEENSEEWTWNGNLNDTIKKMFEDKVAFCGLKTLKLSPLNLHKIWNDGQHSMYNITVLIVENCGELKYLFSSTMVQSFVNLKRLEISNCNLMNEIIATERRNDVTIALKEVPFPKLETIVLKDMENLKTGFYAENHILACPSLRKLDVANCAKLNLYKTVAPSASRLQRCVDENLSDLFQPLFIVEEVIPHLEWMRINDRNAMMILQSQNLDSLFNKLTFLGLSNYKNEEATFPYWFLQTAHSLEWLNVERSSFKKIFEDERLVSMKIHTRLKKLTLYQLPKLQHICEEGSQIHPVLEVLECLNICHCPSLTNLLLPSSVTFSHLTYLEITKCNKLVNLITSSTAQSLVKLTELKVEDCGSLQEIIMGKENVDIAFVSLEILILKDLPSLNNFCSSKCCLKFPLLEDVVVSKCPHMEIFSEGNTSTPSLRTVRIEENSEEWTWKGNLNDTIKEMFEDKALASPVIGLD
ncbi:hypothetical protein QL285_036836 [Trifolium repens]|nr:hypothetical protein QL285_036836 [Trifolium repens]